MKIAASLCSLAAFSTLLALSADATAQPSAQRPTGATISTADYSEQSLGGDQVVRFTGDELVGPAGGAYGDIIRRPPGVTRLGLIRPRMNFVADLLKSVESL